MNIKRYLPQIYKKTGLDWLVRKSEKVLGEVDEPTRLQIENGYALGTGILVAGSLIDYFVEYPATEPFEPFLYIAPACIYFINIIHHRKMHKYIKKIEQMLEMMDEQTRSKIEKELRRATESYYR